MENERRRTTADGGEHGFDRSFGRRLRNLRTKRGWSQDYLAQRVTEGGTAIHQTQVAKLEAGTRAVRLSEAVALAGSLGSSLGVLVPHTSIGGHEDQYDSADNKRERLRELEEIDRTVAETEKSLQVREAELAQARRRVEQEFAEVVESRQRLRVLEERSANLKFRLNQELHQLEESEADAPEEAEGPSER